MFPFDLHIGQALVPIHAITDIVAAYVGIWYYERTRSQTPSLIGDSKRTALFLAGLVGALVGAHGLSLLESPDALASFSPAFFLALSGKTIVGGIIGASLAIEAAKRLLGVTTSTGDVFVYPAILGMIIGRVGCFLTGVTDGTVGNPSSMPWALNQGDGVLRHPTSLYEILFLACLWFLVRKFESRYVLENGIRFRIFVVAYLTFRFFVEFIKPVHPIVAGLTAIQISSALVAAGYLVSLINSRHFRNRLSAVQ